MRNVVFVMFIFGVFFSVDASADERIRDARDAVKDSIDAVRDEGRRCKRKTLSELKDASRALKKQNRRPRLGKLRILQRELKDVLDEASDSCPGNVTKKIRKALRYLRKAQRVLADRDDQDSDEDDDGDDDDRRKIKEKKKPKWYPTATASKDCRDLWFMERLVLTTNNSPTLRDPIRALRKLACRTNRPMGPQSWPNGATAKFKDGTWRYPNGATAKFQDGTWRYPSGATAKFQDNTWRYQNGSTARFSDGTWRFPNGRRAGSIDALQAWACSKLGDKGCADLEGHLHSAMPEWRMYTLIEMAWWASKK